MKLFSGAYPQIIYSARDAMAEHPAVLHGASTAAIPALSIMQPWAWLVAHRHKPWENRTWSTKYRGPFQIHAGLKVDRDAEHELRAGRNPCSGTPLRLDLPERFETGGIVGTAAIVACVTHADDDWFVGPFGFLIAGAEPVPFRPCKGRLGFFDPDFSSPPVARPLTTAPLDLFTSRGQED